MEWNIGTCEGASGECCTRVSVRKWASVVGLFHLVESDGYECFLLLWAIVAANGLRSFEPKVFTWKT